MSATRDFGDLMIHEIRLRTYAGMNSRGEPTYNSSVRVKCRIERTPNRVLLPDRTETISSATIYLDASPEIDTRDQVELPDGSKPIILSLNKQADDVGDYYQAVLV